MSYPWVKEAGVQVQSSRASETPSLGYGTQAPAIRDKLKNLPHEITDEDIERDKAGNRGLFMAEFQKILNDCDSGDPDDPRWHELRLRTLDRMAKLTRVYEADAPSQKQGPGNPKDLANQAAAALVEIEASLAETRVN